MGFCENPLENWIIGVSFFGNDQVGIVKLIVGILYIVMAAITVLWIQIQSKNAQYGDNEAVKSVIFPIFTNMMWISAFTSLSVALVILFIPVDLTARNDNNARWLYPAVFTLQHIVLEGVAFLLMQKGCGKYAAWNAGKMLLVWGIITLAANVVGYSPGFKVSTIALLTWDSSILIFYFLLWTLPQNRLFRRPAAIPYAKFWFFFRVMEITLYGMSQAGHSIAGQIGRCGYVFGPLFIFTIFQPIIMYWTLLADSRWWQGVDIEITGRHSIHSPLGGIDISLFSAQTLARTMDALGEQRTTRLLNFAHIEIDRNKLLGQGSFSRVYRGTYRQQKCAIKLIYTMDLTEDVIQRVAAEANILSSMNNPNIVKIYGISVLPPSVCILLELCAFGSLSDILRGDTGTSVRKLPFRLTLMDRLFLATGCAKGLAALHSLGPEVVHRDIKSLNFLVDSQLNAKLADLELGAENTEVAERSALVSDDLLENWAAPELFDNRPYTQKCDVYSLALVLWEIISGKIPYADVPLRSSIRQMIVRGDRPTMVECPQPYEDIVKAGWASEPNARPSVHELVEVLQRVLISSCSSAGLRLEAVSQIRPIVEAFYQSDCGLEYIQAIKDHKSAYLSRSSSISLTGAHGSGSFQLSNQIVMAPLHSSVPSTSIPSSPQKPPRNSTSSTSSGETPFSSPQKPHRHSTSSTSSGEKERTERESSDITVNPPNDIESPPLGRDDTLRSSDSNSSIVNGFVAPVALSRHTLHDIFDLMQESPSHSILDQLAHYTKHNKLANELEYVYQQIENDSTWKLIDELYDPVVILSGRDPYFILKCSMAWLSMLGYTSSQVFGKIFDNFVSFQQREEESERTRTQQAASPAPSTSMNEVITTLESFYSHLENSNPSHNHWVLPLLHSQQHSIKCSVHCFPIYKKLTDSETMTEKPRYFLQRSSRESFHSSGSSSVAFYMLYFNSFIVDFDTTPYTPLLSVDGDIPPSVSTTEMSPISSQISSTSMSTNLTDNLRKQGLASDL